ncbi:MAG: NUDIX hydrolase [Candidatus Saccharimonadales bacterium]|nr:NUDIX hydrolase [Candidatus Saccharimonadales bacterium]
MKHLYAISGRIVNFFIRPVWEKLANGKPRSRLLVVHQNEILLVKNWISTQHWRLPGGGVGRSETPLEAAVREIHEEVGLEIAQKQLKKLGRKDIRDGKATIIAELYLLEVDSKSIAVNKAEIVDHGWFKISQLPEDHDSVVDSAIAFYRGIVDNPEHST